MSVFPDDWQYKRKLSISAGQKSGSPSKVVLVISEAALGDENGPLDADGTAPAQNGGGDLRLSSDEAGTLQIPLDVVDFVTDNDHTLAKCVLNINFDDLVSDELWLHWGTVATDTQPAVSDTYGQYAVYDSSIMAYYSLHEDPTGTLYNRADGTSNLTSVGGMTSGDSVAGKVGNAVDFDGINDYLKTAHSVNGVQTFSVEAWLYPHADTGIIAGGDYGTGKYEFYFQLTGGRPQAMLGTGSVNPLTTADGSTIANNTWGHAAITTTGAEQKHFVNGAVTGTVDAHSHGTLNTGNDRPWVGVSNNNNIPQYTEFDGLIQHLAFHSRTLSENDMATRVNSYEDNAAFWTVGTVQGVGGGGGGGGAAKQRFKRLMLGM